MPDVKSYTFPPFGPNPPRRCPACVKKRRHTVSKKRTWCSHSSIKVLMGGLKRGYGGGLLANVCAGRVGLATYRRAQCILVALTCDFMLKLLTDSHSLWSATRRRLGAREHEQQLLVIEADWTPEAFTY